jgi:flagellar basal-body rod modification protein FlgD
MSTVGGVGSNSSTGSTTNSTNSLDGITQTDFLQLLLTQLQNQNPLDPMSSSDFASQLATLTEVGSLNSLDSSFGSLLQVQQLTGGNSLIGKTVAYTPTGSTTPAAGVVTGMIIDSGNVDLTVNNNQVPLSQVIGIN